MWDCNSFRLRHPELLIRYTGEILGVVKNAVFSNKFPDKPNKV